jgi:hypothetical protein
MAVVPVCFFASFCSDITGRISVKFGTSGLPYAKAILQITLHEVQPKIKLIFSETRDIWGSRSADYEVYFLLGCD